MFTPNRVTYVNGSSIKTMRDGGTKLTANMGAGIGGTSSSMLATTFASSQYNYFFSGL